MLCPGIAAYADESSSPSTDAGGLIENTPLIAADTLSKQAEELVNTFYTDTTDGRTSHRNAPALATRISPAANGNTTFINGQWYVVDRSLEVEGRLEIYGKDANIILADGATLKAHGGIFVRSTTPAGEPCALTIWGQTKGTGTLNAGATWGDGDTLTTELKNGHAGAGIGAGQHAHSGPIVIEGGDVFAWSSA